jgi:DMSO/TMAO reductase YedYZ molybdopterin-dependent catalytic subunit
VQRSLPHGAAAGAVARLAAGLLQLALRFVGIPLPTELLADRFLPLLPVDLFLQVLGHLGGPIAAKELAFVGGAVGPALLGAVAGALFVRLGRRRQWLAALAAALAAGLVGATWPALDASYRGLPAPWAQLAGVASIVAVVGLAAALLVALLPAAGSCDMRVDDGAAQRVAPRRALLMACAGVVLAAATGGLAVRLFRSGTFSYDGTRLLAVPRLPVTPVGQFYLVTKNLVDPDVDPGLWRLEVDGAVERPFQMTLDELRVLARTTREITLECISNRVGYGLLSNALWTGVALGSLIERAQPLPAAVAIAMRGVDGYVHSLDLDRATRGGALVAIAMNGVPLVAKHGAPARAVVPGAYGEVSVKWLTRVTVLDHAEKGYYESQGWMAGTVHTTSVIDFPKRGQRLAAAAPVVVRGVAYAGDRGVSRVELSTNGGRSWFATTIDYFRSPFAWALWSAPWTPSSSGVRTLVVRAYDGAGEVQEQTAHGFAPAGATGLHIVDVVVA